ncbi:MAG TPA: NAD(P)/FAD-dependent oxidoreductase [Acidimicrobiales bacterium]
MSERQHDLVIIGGGTAGVSAALECHDIQLDVVLLEARPVLGGQLVEIDHPVRNVATGRYANGPQLQAGLQASAEDLADRVMTDHAVTAANVAEGWVEAGGRRVRGRALLIASGSAPEHLPVAVEGAFGGDVTYHVENDPDHFAGRPVVVIGGGDSATLDALFLASKGSSVILAHRAESLSARHDIAAGVRAEKRIEDLPGWEVDSVSGGERLEEVVLMNHATGARRTVPAGGLVVKISRRPCTEPFRGQVDLDRRGFVRTDGELRSSRRGVFAAGDVVSGSYWRVSNALGHGSLVSRTILRYLQGQDTEPVDRGGLDDRTGP